MRDYSALPPQWAERYTENGFTSLDIVMERVNNAIAEGTVICPELKNLFKPFHLTPPDKVKCVIMDIYPYFETASMADGLAFSCSSAKGADEFPFCLKMILSELKNDLGHEYPETGDLTKWAEQGVLLFNIAATTTEGMAGGHNTWEWKRFAAEILRLCMAMERPIMFHIWGATALYVSDYARLNRFADNVFVTSHPSPRGYRKGFLHSKPFSATNKFLVAHGVDPIDWDLTRTEHIQKEALL